jgi:urease accessory protein
MASSLPSPIPGTGLIHLLPSGSFSHLAYSYPLKLISPSPLPSSSRGLRIVYLLSYGGGLISGDKIWIEVLVEPGGTLILLTQGTTKVMKRRPRGRKSVLTSSSSSSASRAILSSSAQSHAVIKRPTRPETTTQTLLITLSPSSSLFLLPSPTSCFARSRYTQRQRFELTTCGTASLMYLDWFTSGREKSLHEPTGREGGERGERKEDWAAERMEFFVEVWWGEKRGIAERIVLEDESTTNTLTNSQPDSSIRRGQNDLDPSSRSRLPPSSTPTPPPTSYASSLSPYTIYLTLILAGPLLQPLLSHFLSLQTNAPKILKNLPPPGPRLLWSISLLSDDASSSSGRGTGSLGGGGGGAGRGVKGQGRTAVVRACAVEGEELKVWLEECVGEEMVKLVGKDGWEKAFG